MITTARPDDAIEGEESGSGGVTSARTWLVDPLCDTLNFAAQTPLVSSNVALVHGSTTLAAVSVDLIAREVFWTNGERAAVRCDGNDTHSVRRPSHAWSTSTVMVPWIASFSARRSLSIQRSARHSAPGSRQRPWQWRGWRLAAERRTSAMVTSSATCIRRRHRVCRNAGCIVTDFSGGPLETGRGLSVGAISEAAHSCCLMLHVEPELHQGYVTHSLTGF